MYAMIVALLKAIMEVPTNQFEDTGEVALVFRNKHVNLSREYGFIKVEGKRIGLNPEAQEIVRNIVNRVRDEQAWGAMAKTTEKILTEVLTS